MSTDIFTNGDIKGRLSTLVNELAGGSARQFAEQCGIKQATLHNYLKGRPPSTEALTAISYKYRINLNWLVLGEGSQYLSTNDNNCCHHQSLHDIQKWLEETEQKEPDIWTWFKIQFTRKFPDYAEWKKKHNTRSKGNSTEYL